MCVNPNLLIPLTLPLSPLLAIYLFFTVVSLFLLHK